MSNLQTQHRFSAVAAFPEEEEEKTIDNI